MHQPVHRRPNGYRRLAKYLCRTFTPASDLDAAATAS
jgi:hypothetical protein